METNKQYVETIDAKDRIVSQKYIHLVKVIALIPLDLKMARK